MDTFPKDGLLVIHFLTTKKGSWMRESVPLAIFFEVLSNTVCPCQFLIYYGVQQLFSKYTVALEHIKSTIFPLYSIWLLFQGASFSANRSCCRTVSGSQIQCSSLANPFLQLKNNFQSSIHRQSSSCLTLRSYKRIISAEADKKGWDFGRFVKTLYFFNGPPSPAKVGICQSWFSALC